MGGVGSVSYLPQTGLLWHERTRTQHYKVDFQPEVSATMRRRSRQNVVALTVRTLSPVEELCTHLIISHLSLNHEGRWGTTDDFATSFLHFSMLFTALWELCAVGAIIFNENSPDDRFCHPEVISFFRTSLHMSA